MDLAQKAAELGLIVPQITMNIAVPRDVFGITALLLPSQIQTVFAQSPKAL